MRGALKVYESGDLRTLYACRFCGSPFVPNFAAQRTCGDAQCQDRRRYQNKLDRMRNNPDAKAQARARNRRWCAERRGCKRRQPWLVGQPPYFEYLPGGGIELHVRPRPKWPIEHRNTRALHGMVTDLTGMSHGRWPRFSLVPWHTELGWGVYLWHEEAVKRMAGRTLKARLFDRDVEVQCSLPRRIRAPQVAKRGRQRVRLDAITTVAITSTGRTRPHIKATADSLLSALLTEFPERLGVEHLEKDMVRIEMVENSTNVSHVRLGAKYGLVRGWTGSCVLEVNAPARWLLECAARVGLGGRTAFGFGRVRVTEC